MAEDLRELAAQLETETGEDRQIEILQQMGRLLLRDYVLCVGDLTIEPLMVEAYYYSREKFPDPAVHSAAYRPGCHRLVAAQAYRRQRKNFGRLYVHRHKFDGIDLCLTDSETSCLSFLIKNSLVNGAWKTQMGLARALCGPCGKCREVEDCIYNETQVLRRRKEPKNITAAFLPRKGIRGKYAAAPLGAVPLENLRDYPFTLPAGFGKERVAEACIDRCFAPEDRQEACRKYLGYCLKKYRQDR